MVLPPKFAPVFWLPAAAVAAGLLIRLALMPTAIYGDLHAIAYALHLFGFHGVTNIYAALHTISPDQSPVPGLGVDFFPYPPLTYYVLGGAMALLRPLYGDGFSAAISARLPELLAAPGLAWWLTLYKLPLLAADLGIAATLASLGRDARQRWRLAALWMLNPIPIVACYLFGQFDVLPALCVLLAWVAVVRGHPWLAAVALGVGAGFKTYPLLLLLPFALIVGRSWLERAGLVAAGLATFALTFLPVANNPVTFEVVFGADPARRVLRSGIVVGEVFDTVGSIYLVFMLWTLVTLHAAQWAAGRPLAAWRYMLAVLLLTYAFAYSHLQWFTWAAPFLVLDWVQRPANRLTQIVMYGAVLVIAASWQVGPLLEFFRPVSPELGEAWPAFGDLVEPYMSTPDVANILRSLLAGAALYWTWANVFRSPIEELPARLPAGDGSARDGITVFTRRGGAGRSSDQAAG